MVSNKSLTKLNKAAENVVEYMKRNGMNYSVCNVIPHSWNENNYLYYVLAKKKTYDPILVEMGFGPYVVWICWNESTKCLNHGHYDLTLDRALRFLESNI